MVELSLGHESPEIVRKSKEYKEGLKAFQDGVSISDNPYVGVAGTSGWYWSFGWHDACQRLVLGLYHVN